MKKLLFFITVAMLVPSVAISVTTALSTKKQKKNILYLHERNVRSLEQSKLNHFIQDGNVILIFYEDWCGPCKRMAPIIEDIAQSAHNILFIKLKRSLYQTLFTQFGFTAIPAMVFCKKGKVVHKRPRSATKEEFLELIHTHFM